MSRTLNLGGFALKKKTAIRDRAEYSKNVLSANCADSHLEKENLRNLPNLRIISSKRVFLK
jgi:hypothetical protein